MEGPRRAQPRGIHIPSSDYWCVCVRVISRAGGDAAWKWKIIAFKRRRVFIIRAEVASIRCSLDEGDTSLFSFLFLFFHSCLNSHSSNGNRAEYPKRHAAYDTLISPMNVQRPVGHGCFSSQQDPSCRLDLSSEEAVELCDADQCANR